MQKIKLTDLDNSRAKFAGMDSGGALEFLADVNYAEKIKEGLDTVQTHGYTRDAAMIRPIYDLISNHQIDRHEAYKRLKEIMPSLPESWKP